MADLESKRRLLEELAQRLGIDVRYEPFGGPLRSAGGLCRIRSRRVILIDSRAQPAEQVGVLIDALARQDLDSIFVPPALRRDLEARR